MPKPQAAAAAAARSASRRAARAIDDSDDDSEEDELEEAKSDEDGPEAPPAASISSSTADSLLKTYLDYALDLWKAQHPGEDPETSASWAADREAAAKEVALRQFEAAAASEAWIVAPLSHVHELLSDSRLTVASESVAHTAVVRWANALRERPAVKRGRRVNTPWSDNGVMERHSAADLD